MSALFFLSSGQQARIFLLEQFAAIEERLAAGTSEKLQVSSLVGAFVRARELQ